ncbi:MAG: MarR family transcriptional regulator [Ramlibacter sp.]
MTTRSGMQLARPEVLDDLLLYRLIRLQSAAGGIVLRYCEGQFGITRREWRIVALLAAHGPLGSSELAAHAGLDRSRTSKAVTGLVAKNLVSRESAAGDARYVLLALTPQGAGIHAQLFPVVSAINQEVLAALEPGEMALLDDILARLQQRAERMAAREGLPLADRRHGGSGHRLKRV